MKTCCDSEVELLLLPYNYGAAMKCMLEENEELRRVLALDRRN